MIRISIVTITYNAARSLQRTLDSVRSQQYPHIEHLIIDGASKDDTVKIAEEYKKTSPHEVRIQSEPDKGLYDAMNKGLQKATGDYVVFLNAGDSQPCSHLWRHCDDGCGRKFPQTAQTQASQDVDVALV